MQILSPKEINKKFVEPVGTQNISRDIRVGLTTLVALTIDINWRER